MNIYIFKGMSNWKEADKTFTTFSYGADDQVHYEVDGRRKVSDGNNFQTLHTDSWPLHDVCLLSLYIICVIYTFKRIRKN